MADKIEQILVPDIGGATDVAVIEIMVAPGDSIAEEDSLITLEGDKATMEVPSPAAGIVKEIKLKVGDKVSEGSLVLLLATEGSAAESESASATPAAEANSAPKADSVETAPVSAPAQQVTGDQMYAGPAVRRLARELDINLSQVKGSGDKGRITKEDIKRHLQGASAGGSGLALPEAPTVDFNKFGETEAQELSKIQKFSGVSLHRNWVTIPHVTQFIDADITDLEAFRQNQKKAAADQGVRLTPLVFIMKAVVAALKAHPRFNASLDASGENLILKKYFHIGVAVDTPQGLVVPVIRDVNQKTVFELAKELGEISRRAREEGLSIKEMQGGCFTISSLGGIGGTAFTPIINAPEVAILGVSRSENKPVYQKDGSLAPRLMLPLSLSYDHRVIDGADGARFSVFLAKCLSDIRTLILY